MITYVTLIEWFRNRPGDWDTVERNEKLLVLFYFESTGKVDYFVLLLEQLFSRYFYFYLSTEGGYI